MLAKIPLIYVRLPLLSILCLCLAALGGCRQPPPVEPPAAPLRIAGWAGYIPQTMLDGFAEEFGVQVEYVIYSSQDEAIEQIRSGISYDVVVMGNSYIPQLVAEGLLAKLDYSNIPNFHNISPNFRDLAFDPGNQYSAPFQWGTTGLVVRTDRAEAPITRWADLWDARYAGKIGLWPLQGDILGMALKSLGYSINSDNPAQLREAEERLLALRRQVFLIDPNLPTGVSYLLDDSTVMIHGWSYDALAAQEELDTVAYVLPKEGTMLWTDNLVIPTETTQKQTAEQFINYVLRPEVSAQIVNEIYIATPNDAARPLIRPEILNDPAVFPKDESLQDAEFFVPLPPEVQQLHDEIWQRFLTEGDRAHAALP
ncbi:MAG TPA: spermidine/putrescine ABC transporter substrate-binding protein [Caldilineaceae bacterium]|nr:spermidine/putrescine ABC transporter substrate-binding protein [Caldilineaceae bacterium]